MGWCQLDPLFAYEDSLRRAPLPPADKRNALPFGTIKYLLFIGLEPLDYGAL